jgi:uncharacterized membrane protein YciS (DUF1049 family)
MSPSSGHSVAQEVQLYFVNGVLKVSQFTLKVLEIVVFLAGFVVGWSLPEPTQLAYGLDHLAGLLYEAIEFPLKGYGQ